VFGNPDLEKDNLVVKLLPRLKKKFPEIEFRLEDPVEGLRPPPDVTSKWVIIDVGVPANVKAAGQEEIKVFDDVDKIEVKRRVGLHDYGLGMELKLLEKLGKIKKLKIIVVPMKMRREKALQGVIKALRGVIPKELRHKY